MIQTIKTWYRGKRIPPPGHPDDPLVIVGRDRYKQPELAKILRAIGRFCLAHWKWIIGTAIAVITLIIAIVTMLRY